MHLFYYSAKNLFLEPFFLKKLSFKDRLRFFAWNQLQIGTNYPKFSVKKNLSQLTFIHFTDIQP